MLMYGLKGHQIVILLILKTQMREEGRFYIVYKMHIGGLVETCTLQGIKTLLYNHFGTDKLSMESICLPRCTCNVQKVAKNSLPNFTCLSALKAVPEPPLPPPPPEKNRKDKLHLGPCCQLWNIQVYQSSVDATLCM